jgi:hypothetical protein
LFGGAAIFSLTFSPHCPKIIALASHHFFGFARQKKHMSRSVLTAEIDNYQTLAQARMAPTIPANIIVEFLLMYPGYSL